VTDPDRHLYVEVVVDDQLAAVFARKGIVSFRPGDRVRLGRVRGFERTPEAEAAFTAYAGQFDTDTTTGSQDYKKHLSDKFAERHVDAFELLP
jgi:hypothetical protein